MGVKGHLPLPGRRVLGPSGQECQKGQKGVQKGVQNDHFLTLLARSAKRGQI